MEVRLDEDSIGFKLDEREAKKAIPAKGSGGFISKGVVRILIGSKRLEKSFVGLLKDIYFGQEEKMASVSLPLIPFSTPLKNYLSPLCSLYDLAKWKPIDHENRSEVPLNSSFNQKVREMSSTSRLFENSGAIERSKADGLP